MFFMDYPIAAAIKPAAILWYTAQVFCFEKKKVNLDWCLPIFFIDGGAQHKLLGGHETLKTWQEFKRLAHMHIVWSSPIGQRSKNIYHFGILLSVRLYCKCFVCRNCKCLSVITIQKQTLVDFTDIYVGLITDIFMLFFK